MAPDVLELRLLSAVTPIFLKVSTFYFRGKDAEAVQARHKLRAMTPFYTYLHQDFKKLGEVLEGLRTPRTVSTATIGSIIRLLEHLERNSSRTLCHISRSLAVSEPASTERNFPRLVALQHQIEAEKAPDFRRLIRLRNNSPEQFKDMLSALKECLKQLERDVARTRLAIPSTHEPAIPKASSSGRRKHPAYHTNRQYANSVHKILLQNWNCVCKTPHTAAMICLAPDLNICSHEDSQCNCEQARFEFFFTAVVEHELESEPGHIKWQQGQVGILNHQRVTHLQDPKGDKTSVESNVDERWDRVHGICGLLQTASQRRQYLQLRLRGSELRYRFAQHDEYDIAQRTLEASQTLAHFLSGDQTPFSFHQVRRAERFALAVVLANALLYLQEGPWCAQYLEATQIFFHKSSDPAVPNFRRPYLLTRCETVDSVVPSPQIFEHPYPSLFSFGCLLMEMELKRSINSDSRQDVRDAMDEASDLKAEYGKSFEQYFEAIDACLDIFRFKPGATFQSGQFLDEVYAAIVCPLETVLYECFPNMVSNLSTPVGPLDVLSFRTLQSISSTARLVAPTQVSAIIQTNTTDNSPAPILTSTAALSLRNSRYPRHTAPGILSQVSTYDGPSGVFLHDHVHDSDSVNPEKCDKYRACLRRSQLIVYSAREADEWLKTLKQRVHPLITRPNMGSGTERIRVAILDTGLELPEDCRSDYANQIRGCRSWLGVDENEEGNSETRNFDVSGHGTHSTGLLLEVAPNAEVFVARVFENPDKREGQQTIETTQRRVSQAIRYAVDKWKVHIITMSFGFEKSVDIIDDAITYACGQKVLILAAASNCGGNFDLTWPASSHQVLCIYATTGLGNPYRRNPTQRSHKENFATLGSAVDSWWPEHLGQPQNRVRKSGTSASTPIAAGIAAIVMEIVRQPDRIEGLSSEEKRKFKQLGTVDGMSAVFRRMTGENGKRHGYDYLAPWETLHCDHHYPTTIVDNILMDLS